VPIRVVIADDEPAARKLALYVLSRAHGIDVVGEAEDGASALRLAREHRPDVLVLDNHMPGQSGLEIAAIVSAELPKTRIVLRSMDPHAVTRASASGVHVTMPKDAPIEQLVSVVRDASMR
jgi:DNA-binding NarL/FixJ family response regulator